MLLHSHNNNITAKSKITSIAARRIHRIVIQNTMLWYNSMKLATHKPILRPIGCQFLWPTLPSNNVESHNNVNIVGRQKCRPSVGRQGRQCHCVGRQCWPLYRRLNKILSV